MNQSKQAYVKDFDPKASIRRFYDAENEFCRAEPHQRDIRLMLNELDPDVIVEVPKSLPHGGTWRGHAGFVDLFAAVSKHWQEFVVGYNDAQWHLIDDGRVLSEGVLRAVLSATGKRVEMPVASLFTFTSRGVSHLVHYYKDTAAIVMTGE
jgi:ketosteroid isomerase-like protein